MTFSSSRQPKSYPTVRPIIATSIDGITFKNQKLYAIDSRNGFIIEINPLNSITSIVNDLNWQDFIGAKGLCFTDKQLWFTRQENIYSCEIKWNGDTLEIISTPKFCFCIPYCCCGIGIYNNTIYLTTQKTGHILVYSLTGEEITKFYAPGIGSENITIKEEETN